MFLPPGYATERRTLEKGGGTILLGGVKMRPNSNFNEQATYSVASGRRVVASWQGTLGRRHVERLARLDAQMRSAPTREEYRLFARRLALEFSGGGVSRLGLGDPKKGFDPSKNKRMRNKIAKSWEGDEEA